MALDRIALVSDIHGNLTAMDAVLADIDRRGIDRIFNLGDFVGKGPRGREVIARSQERCEVNLLGNWDDFLPDPDREIDNEALRWWRDQMGPHDGTWLRQLPFSHDLMVSGRQVRFMHASAVTVHRRVRYRHDQAEFVGQFEITPATGDGPVPDTVIYADTHDPMYECQLRGRHLINTGSVGNCMGDPTPLYLILEGEVDNPEPAPFGVAFVRVPYDVEAELAYARGVGMPEFEGYAVELRHGIYRGSLEEFRSGALDLDGYYH